MSIRHSSRALPVYVQPIGSAADLMAAVTSDPDLGPRKKEAARSGIRTICRGLGRPPESVAIADLERGLKTVEPAQCGIGARTLANAKSNARRAILKNRRDIIDTRSIPMSPEWRALFQATGDDHVAKSCGRFARWATAQSILPDAVSQAVADRYAADLGVRLPSVDARGTFTNFCRAWGRCVAAYPAIWPQVHLDAGDRRRIDVLPFSQIDSGFLADLEKMLACFGSCLDRPSGFKAAFVPSTIKELRRIMLRLYSISRTQCASEQTISSLADLVRVETAHSILSYYLERFGNDNTKSTHKYAHFLYIVAKYWVQSSADDLETLKAFRRKTKPIHQGMTEKNRAMLRQFEDDGLIHRILRQGADALRKFERIKSPKFRDALDLQSAMAIELLTAVPVRSQNLSSISLDRHLVWQTLGKHKTAHIVFPASEVKNKIDLDFKLPQRVLEILCVYLEKARPLLTKDGSPFLFPSNKLGHKAPSQLSNQIAAKTRLIIGARITAHQFRHLVGFLYLKDNPGGHEVVRNFLGHKHIDTTLKFYAGMEQDAAIAHFDRHIESLRERYGLAKPAPHNSALRLMKASAAIVSRTEGAN